MIRFKCRQCGKALEAPDEKAGAKYTCPKCRFRGAVAESQPPPLPSSDARNFESDDRMITPKVRPPRSDGPEFSDWMGLVALLFAVAAFCLQGVAIFFWLAYPFAVCAIVLGGITVTWGRSTSWLALLAVLIGIIALSQVYPSLSRYWERNKSDWSSPF